MNSYLIVTLLACSGAKEQATSSFFEVGGVCIVPRDGRPFWLMEVQQPSHTPYRLDMTKLAVRAEIYKAGKDSGLPNHLWRSIGEYLGDEPSYPHVWLRYTGTLRAGTGERFAGFAMHCIGRPGHLRTVQLRAIYEVTHSNHAQEKSDFWLPDAAYNQRYVQYPTSENHDGVHFKTITYLATSELYAFVHIIYWPLHQPHRKKELFQSYELRCKETREALFNQLFAEPKQKAQKKKVTFALQ